MKIQRISWQNFKGLTDGEIVANGRDVIISGRNGAGKSSIASILPFVLFGKIAAKSFDERGITIETQIPTATIEFDTITFKRSVTPRNQNRTFIDGQEVPATQFNAKVLELTGGIGTLFFNPFEFPNLNWKNQRDFLLKYFAENVQLPTTDEFKAELSQLKKNTADLPGRIAEILRQLDDIPTGDISEIENRIDDLQAELTQIQAEKLSGNAENDSTKRAIADLQRQENFFKSRLKAAQTRRDELRKRYHAIKDTCPTCGQKLPKNSVTKARDEIVTLGRQAAQEVADNETELARVQSELETLKNKVAEPSFDAAKIGRMRTLQKEISDLQSKRANLKNADKLRERLARLTESEKSLNAKITELEGKIAHAQQLQRQQMTASENRVNQQFEFVTFKLFKLLANGELRETCEAMINGVPYSALSKGEKFKAALDIFRSLQEKFQLEMPLFLDDAESYTSNSFVEIPNQLFLFKVTEDDLKISVGEMRRAA